MEELILDIGDAIAFIEERCDVPRDDIERVLDLETEFMRKMGIIMDIELHEE